MKTTNDILNWALEHPLMRDGVYVHPWHMWDGALLYRLGVAPAAPSVEHLRRSVDTINPYAFEAPVGAVHFFESATIGHAVVDVFGGGNTVLEATEVGLRYVPIEKIMERLHYLGWVLFPDAAERYLKEPGE